MLETTLALTIPLVFIALTIWAALRIVRTQTGSALPLWLLVILIAPFIGSILALIAVPDNSASGRKGNFGVLGFVFIGFAVCLVATAIIYGIALQRKDSAAEKFIRGHGSAEMAPR